MAVAVHHIPTADPSIVMPDALLVRTRADRAITGIPGAMPGPIALENFVSWAAGYFRGFDRNAIAAGCRVFYPEPIKRPHGKIAVSPGCVTGGFGFGWPVGISMVRRAMKGFSSRNVCI